MICLTFAFVTPSFSRPITEPLILSRPVESHTMRAAQRRFSSSTPIVRALALRALGALRPRRTSTQYRPFAFSIFTPRCSQRVRTICIWKASGSTRSFVISTPAKS